jgi:hypothetical protein
MSVPQYRLPVVKLVNKRGIVQQRIEPCDLVLAFVRENRDEHRVTGRHDGVRHECLAGRNVGMSRALLKFEKRALLFKSYAASAI